MSVPNNREIPFLSLIEHREDDVPVVKFSDFCSEKGNTSIRFCLSFVTHSVELLWRGVIVPGKQVINKPPGARI